MPGARYPDLGGDAVGRARTDESDATGVGRSKVSPACLDHVIVSEAEGEAALSEIDGHTVEGKVLTCRQGRAIGHKIQALSLEVEARRRHCTEEHGKGQQYRKNHEEQC